MSVIGLNLRNHRRGNSVATEINFRFMEVKVIIYIGGNNLTPGEINDNPAALGRGG